MIAHYAVPKVVGRGPMCDIPLDEARASGHVIVNNSRSVTCASCRKLMRGRRERRTEAH